MKPSGTATLAPKRTIRCAVYTRKSTDEGLEQDFNSLDAQREAGEAYIASQKSEGWTCLATCGRQAGGRQAGSLRNADDGATLPRRKKVLPFLEIKRKGD